MQSVLSDVERKVSDKERIYNETLDKLGTAGDRKEIRSIESEFRKRIGGAGASEQGSDQTIRVRRKSDGQSGTIKPSDFDAGKYEKL
jgi:hypothetical protein